MDLAGRLAVFARALVTGNLEFEYERMPYRLEGVTSRKLAAVVRTELACMRPRLFRPRYPTQLQIETSSVCSLRCPLCPAGMGEVDGPHATMPFSIFSSLLDEVGDHALVASLWMWGEPLMNPDLPEMIAYAHSKNVGTVISTNGQHTRTRDDAERLVASGLDNLIVALDGATQETYAGYRIGGDIRNVLRCLELVRQAKITLGSRTPFVNVRTVVMKQNEHELADIDAIARMYGADMVSRKTAFIPDRFDDAADWKYLPSDPRYQRYQYRDGRRVRRYVQDMRCRRPWNKISVSVDGTVLLCEFDTRREATLGQVGWDGSFMDIWRGDKAQSIRRRFVDDRAYFGFCADCHFRDSGGSDCTVEATMLAGK